MHEPPKTDHVYDGIEEYDNPLPGWWKWLFVATVVFSPLYWMYYHGDQDGRLIEDQYSVALAENTRLQFAEIGELTADSATIARYMGEPDWLRVGESVFRSHCIQCHGRGGEGLVGPNLTDDHYKSVSSLEDIARVVSNGAGGGAMPQWSHRLHANEVVLVSAYVASLRGGHAEGGRMAEGKVIAPWDAAE